MQNAPYLDPLVEKFLEDFEFDHDVQLIGIETDEAEQVETLQTWNGHQVGYSSARINHLSFAATGFIWKHPHGAIISGEFAKPIKACEFTLDADRDELESDSLNSELRAAIVAKCGNISGFADSLLN